MIDSAFLARVDNWVRWSRGNKGEPNDHCGSVEWRYTPEKGNLYDSAPGSIPADALDAQLVEAAWRKCSKGAKFLLKYDLHHKRPPGWILRKLGRPKAAYKLVKFDALMELSRFIDSPTLRR